jgi:predicted metal-binding protein
MLFKSILILIFRLAVNNSNNRSSTVMVINVLLCTGCSGHGVCSNVTRDDQQQTEYFKYSECICKSPYDGNDNMIANFLCNVYLLTSFLMIYKSVSKFLRTFTDLFVQNVLEIVR